MSTCGVPPTTSSVLKWVPCWCMCGNSANTFCGAVTVHEPEIVVVSLGGSARSCGPGRNRSASSVTLSGSTSRTSMLDVPEIMVSAVLKMWSWRPITVPASRRRPTPAGNTSSLVPTPEA